MNCIRMCSTTRRDPESGNDIPDVLDEVKYEIDWLLKMQDATSGAVYSGVSSVDNKSAGYLLYVDGINMNATVQFCGDAGEIQLSLSEL